MILEDLYLEYGNEFLHEEKDETAIVNEMAYLEQFLRLNPIMDVFSAGAYSYGFFGGSFDFRAPYFVTDAAGNYASLDEHQLVRYYERVIEDRYFIDWLYENGIIDDREYKQLQYEIS